MTPYREPSPVAEPSTLLSLAEYQRRHLRVLRIFLRVTYVDLACVAALLLARVPHANTIIAVTHGVGWYLFGRWAGSYLRGGPRR